MSRIGSSALKFLAGVSERCPVCKCARQRQAGAAFRLVKTFESLCPFCRAYHVIHGRKSHEALPGTASLEKLKS